MAKMKRVVIELPEKWLEFLNNELIDKYGFDLKNTLHCLMVELYINSESLDMLLTKRSLGIKHNLLNSRYHELMKLNQIYHKPPKGFMSPELSSEASKLFQNLVNIEKQLITLDKPIKSCIIG